MIEVDEASDCRAFNAPVNTVVDRARQMLPPWSQYCQVSFSGEVN